MKPEHEMAFMKGLLATWGKTWHTWPDPTTPVPMGEPMPIWSLTGDGPEDPKVIAARDKEFGVKTTDVIGRQCTASGEDKPTRK